jgi:hypothetical protein
MDVFVTIQYRLTSVCSAGDFGPGEPVETLDTLVRNLIEEEGASSDSPMTRARS